MTEKGKGLKERAAAGEYQLIDPLDYKILERMIKEGELFAGLYPLGDTTMALGKKFTEIKGGLPSEVIVTRMRVLHVQGLVKKIDGMVGTNGRSIWQRTKEGTKVVDEWKRNQGGDSNDSVSG